MSFELLVCDWYIEKLVQKRDALHRF